MDELLKELQALIDKYAEGTPEGVTEEEAKQDEERMAELTAEIERKTTEQAEQRKTRAAAVAAGDEVNNLHMFGASKKDLLSEGIV